MKSRSLDIKRWSEPNQFWHVDKWDFGIVTTFYLLVSIQRFSLQIVFIIKKSKIHTIWENKDKYLAHTRHSI